MTSNVEELVDIVCPALHAKEYLDAANAFNRATGTRTTNSTQESLRTLNMMLRWCLDRDRKDLAAKLLWSPAQFTPTPRSVNLIWQNVEAKNFVLCMGASSMGKTYTVGVNFFLEWLRDPYYTLVRCVGPSEDHLQANLFTHLVMLHESASLPLPGKVQDLFIGLNPRNKKGGILGTVIPIGKKSAGRLQGAKRAPRPVPHKIFGGMSRMFVLVDELEKVPQGLYADMQNLVSNLIDNNDRGFKFVGCFNPQDTTLPPYGLAEPPQGWASFDVEKDEVWTSKAGYTVVRLDAEKSENVVENRVVYPGLQTAAGLSELGKQSGGRESPGYRTFGRGAYPVQGNSYTLMTEMALDERVGTPIFVDPPVVISGVDLALEGGDHIRHAHGYYGIASGVRKIDGSITQFVDVAGRATPRPVICLRDIISLPKGETVESARNVKESLLAVRADPAWSLLDRTGVGTGVHDILKTLWSPVLPGLNYSESATQTKILVEDTQNCGDRFGTGRVVSELWIALRTLLDHGYVWFDPRFIGVPKVALWKQLTNRRYAPNKSDRVESKKEYKDRGHPSPDEADAFTLMVHQARMMAGPVFSITRSSDSARARGDAPAPSMAVDMERTDNFYIDPTNLFEALEDY